MNRFLIVLLSLATLLGSCRVSEEAASRKAQKKLRKALKWDPTTLARQTTDTTIRDTIRTTVAVPVPGKVISSSPINPDSLIEKLKELQNKLYSRDTGKNALYLYKDSAASIYVKKDQAGNLSVIADIKPDTIYLPVEIPYEKKITVPGKAFKVYQKAPIYNYWQFWVVVAISVVTTYLWLSKIIQANRTLKSQ